MVSCALEKIKLFFWKYYLIFVSLFRLALNSRSFCLSFLSAEIMGMHHKDWHNFLNIRKMHLYQDEGHINALGEKRGFSMLAR
jgi:hypothetical protein